MPTADNVLKINGGNYFILSDIEMKSRSVVEY